MLLCAIFFSRKLKECQVESGGRPRNKPPPPPRRYRPSSTNYTPSLKQVEPLSQLDTKWSKRGLIQRYFIHGQFDLIHELIQGVYVTYICNVVRQPKLRSLLLLIWFLKFPLDATPRPVRNFNDRISLLNLIFYIVLIK